MNEPISAIAWQGDVDGCLTLLDQTQLPGAEVWIACHRVEEVWDAIKRLSVRGAPAIGVAAAYGVCLAGREADVGSVSKEAVFAACDYLATSRPTAVNLFWAIERMRQVAQAAEAERLADVLLAEARMIHAEDRQLCSAIGQHGVELLAPFGRGVTLMTHCNAGALATGGEGTALAVVYAADRAGLAPKVFANETRPLLQGARLTTWELTRSGIETTLVCDSMAAAIMASGKIDVVVTGADRIAANGDAANKIGTYGVALAAEAHGVPFYMAAPTTTFDWSLATGAEIPIEQRNASEITDAYKQDVVPAGVSVYNPAFDVTPHRLIAGIITEHGVHAPEELGQIRNR